jgi:hypothetical protein
MNLAGTKDRRDRTITWLELRRAEANGWLLVETVAQQSGTFVNIVSRAGRVRTLRIVGDR